MPQSIQNDAKNLLLFAFGLCFLSFTFYYLTELSRKFAFELAKKTIEQQIILVDVENKFVNYL